MNWHGLSHWLFVGLLNILTVCMCAWERECFSVPLCSWVNVYKAEEKKGTVIGRQSNRTWLNWALVHKLTCAISEMYTIPPSLFNIWNSCLTASICPVVGFSTGEIPSVLPAPYHMSADPAWLRRNLMNGWKFDLTVASAEWPEALLVLVSCLDGA